MQVLKEFQRRRKATSQDSGTCPARSMGTSLLKSAASSRTMQRRPMGLMGGNGSGAGQRNGGPTIVPFGCMDLACVTAPTHGGRPQFSAELTFGGVLRFAIQLHRQSPVRRPVRKMTAASTEVQATRRCNHLEFLCLRSSAVPSLGRLGKRTASSAYVLGRTRQFRLHRLLILAASKTDMNIAQVIVGAMATALGLYYAFLGISAIKYLRNADQADKAVGWTLWWCFDTERYAQEERRLCKTGQLVAFASICALDRVIRC